MSRTKKNKSKVYLGIFFVVFLALLAGGVFYYNWQNQVNEGENISKVTDSDNVLENIGKSILNEGQKIEENQSNQENNQKTEENVENKENTEKVDVNINVYKTSFASYQNFSFAYPKNWQSYELDNKKKISLVPEGKSLAGEYEGDIIVAYKDNKNKLTIERFYDGLNDINLFEDASGGFEKSKVGKNDFYKFKDVVGYASSTVGVVILGGGFVEINDVYNGHQKDEVFNNVVESFKIE